MKVPPAIHGFRFLGLHYILGMALLVVLEGVKTKPASSGHVASASRDSRASARTHGWSCTGSRSGVATVASIHGATHQCGENLVAGAAEVPFWLAAGIDFGSRILPPSSHVHRRTMRMAPLPDAFNSLHARRGFQQRVLFKQASTRAPAASILVGSVGDCSSAASTPPGYTFAAFSASGLPCVLLARAIPCLYVLAMRCGW
ncbi:hypothetical protein B0H14DRAFT_3888805 [Mycena olivaceomarginata]|nr:hypothetical protein B0H14DRAFT_3888805 [Mycena olivaceomarginata]